MTSSLVTPEQVQELKALATAATPGPWESKSLNLGYGSFRAVGPDLINRAAADQDAAYIAAVSPDVVLALRARVTALEAR